jgi:hypothetical protein
MRHFAWTLMVPMFLGCSGANVVSGEDQTEAEKLASDLPSWCEETCNRLSTCDSGDGDDCPEDCQEALSDFSKTTEACADVGRRYQACVDTLGCAELNSEPPCLPSRNEIEACEIDDGDDIGGSVDVPPQAGGGGSSGDDPAPSYGGSISYAGSATGGTGYAGTSAGGSGPVGPVVTCSAGFGSAGAAGSANTPTGPSVTCEEGRADCSDGHEYSWICVDDAAGHNWCSCFLDNNPVGALPSTGMCPSIDLINTGCGWNLANDF